jgi:hypothetical protein
VAPSNRLRGTQTGIGAQHEPSSPKSLLTKPRNAVILLQHSLIRKPLRLMFSGRNGETAQQLPPRDARPLVCAWAPLTNLPVRTFSCSFWIALSLTLLAGDNGDGMGSGLASDSDSRAFCWFTRRTKAPCRSECAAHFSRTGSRSAAAGSEATHILSGGDAQGIVAEIPQARRPAAGVVCWIASLRSQ